ncbi:hypothetical protein [Cellulomonas carbonis]|uniref:Uncharacterized protein n=1 Tax=Cellulomonas carbonis T26 TaxID=947969 RepID=A0A0A0BZ10_9CELL|nr:hypothetical protein [Cellulomonas carbonis]KGM12404.1 hypothetical protein N868_15020 [Cellulomonas carbonis T26]GGC03889.1 hypothetical protein GCM10010972_16220 [Cellulomonas carbonis]
MPSSAAPEWFPFALRLDPLAAMLNAELSDHPVYDGVELQWFDDDVHGTGMLAFLSRREDRTVDYYAAPGLRLDPRGYGIGRGTRSWTVTTFDEATLRVEPDGVVARVRFTDVDGRTVEVDVDDRDGRPRRRARMLAPVSSGIESPRSLLVVWMHEFDLVHVTDRPPAFRIDGQDVATGRLPGRALHRRHLVKYAGPLCSVELCAGDADPARPDDDARVETTADGSGVRAVVVARPPHSARLLLDPPFPDPAALEPAAARSGRWALHVDDAPVTTGAWHLERSDDDVAIALDRLTPWRPVALPPLMRVVTRLVPVFRRWPTTYAWHGTATVASPGAVTGTWRRTGGHDGRAYRRATGS